MAHLKSSAVTDSKKRFSRTEPAPMPAAAPSPWISRSTTDLLLFIATPCLILPLVFLARTKFTIEQIALCVAAFGATGHHLPGLMRAYGDRELFQRFRVRFIVAPICLLTLAIGFALTNLHGLILIGILWATWHALMQVHGFLRIYDSKVRSYSRTTAWLDLLMCQGWFVAGLLLSPSRAGQLLGDYYRSGGPLVPPEWIILVQRSWMIWTALVTAAFFINLVATWRRGTGPSLLKLLLLASSIGFWWYAMVWVNDALLGVALFEIFHDVQYLAIVWFFNRKRSEQPANVGSFTRFLFRRSGLMVGLYLGLVFAYGMIGFSSQSLEKDSLAYRLIGAFLITSGLLHFYYDGFIWKVRDSSMRAALNLTGEQPKSAPPLNAAPWLRHGLRWGIFLVPAGVLASLQLTGNVRSEQERHANIIAAVPRCWESQMHLGVEYVKSGDSDQAERRFRAALQINPESAAACYHLGNLLAKQGQQREALDLLTKAVSKNPGFADAHIDHGALLAELGRAELAIESFEKALAIDPRHSVALVNLGSQHARRGKLREAERLFRRALEQDPANAEVRLNLALALLQRQQRDAAEKELLTLLASHPETAAVYFNLGVINAQRGDLAAANQNYRQAIARNPMLVSAMNSLAWNLATAEDDDVRNAEEAIQWARKGVELTHSKDLGLLHSLAAAYAEAGDFPAALETVSQGLRLAFDAGQSPMARTLTDAQAMYQSGKSLRRKQSMP